MTLVLYYSHAIAIVLKLKGWEKYVGNEGCQLVEKYFIGTMKDFIRDWISDAI